MGIKKSLHWVLIFSLLTLFTGSTFSALGDSRSALAKTLEDNFIHATGQKLVVFESSESVLTNEVVCSIRDEQLVVLADFYETSIENIEVSSGILSVVRVQGDNLLLKDPREFLEERTGEKPACSVVQHNDLFLLLFEASVS